jgi:excisionase family DNA binding protein
MRVSCVACRSSAVCNLRVRAFMYILQYTVTNLYKQVHFELRNYRTGWYAMSFDALLSVDEAAKRLGGISKWTIFAWLSQGRLQRTKVGGRTMVRESELKKVIDDGGKSPAPRRQKETV